MQCIVAASCDLGVVLCRALLHDGCLALHLLLQLPLHREALTLQRRVRRTLFVASLHQRRLSRARRCLNPQERGVLVGGTLALPLRRCELLAQPLAVVRGGVRRGELARDLGRL